MIRCMIGVTIHDTVYDSYNTWEDKPAGNEQDTSIDL